MLKGTDAKRILHVGYIISIVKKDSFEYKNECETMTIVVVILELVPPIP